MSGRVQLRVSEFLEHIERLARGAPHPKACALHFTVDTYVSGVVVPDELRYRLGRYITFVIQHQFWNTRMVGDSFCVTLAFSKVPFELQVPFDSIVNTYTIGDPLPAYTPLPVPSNDEGNVVRVDFQARRRV